MLDNIFIFFVIGGILSYLKYKKVFSDWIFILILGVIGSMLNSILD